MTRTEALPYVSFGVDNALSIRAPSEAPANARLIGWQCGFEPVFIAVWSYLGDRLDDDEAESLAADALEERQWFADGPSPADYLL